jgi:Carboxypeptidase regulatory-like domain
MKSVVGIIICAFVACGSAGAQSVSVSQISGTVKDSTGAVLPGVEIKATQTETAVSRTTITDETGSYTLPNLTVGPYRFEASLVGFSTYIQTGIVLQVNSNPVINVVLQIGQVSETLEVQADVAMVETRSTGVGQVIDNQRVVELPLNGRNLTDLILLSGAAVVTGGFNGNRNYPTQAISVAGGSGGGTAYLLDGADHNDLHNNLNLPLPFPDAMQEFKVETSAVPARYGHHASAAVNAVTKSGSNQIHGDAFWFVRNGVFNARNAFALTRDTLKRNQFGGTLGGPIKQNKLFFFGGYQGTTLRSDPQTSFTFVPTADMLKGDFSAAASPACNAGKQLTLSATDVAGNQLFTNNRVDPSFLNPSMVKLSSYLPSSSDPCGRIQYGFPTKPNDTQILGRVDYQASEKHQIFTRYLFAHYLAPVPEVDPFKNALMLTISGQENRAQSIVLGDTYTLQPNLISSFRGTANVTQNYRLRADSFSPNDLGINLTPLVPKDIDLSVTNAFSLGGGAANRGKWNTVAYQFSQDFDYIHGGHQVSFGVNFVRGIANQYNSQFTNGTISFNGQLTGLGLSDFLLGRVNTITQAQGQRDFERSKYISLYVQDAWKATSRLTIDAGLRWEPFLPMQHDRGWVNHFEKDRFLSGQTSKIFVNAPAGMMFPGDDGYPAKGMVYGNKALFAPRVGLVYDVRGSGKEVIRAGYGVFYDVPPFSYYVRVSSTAPYGGQATLTNPPLPNPWQNYAGGNPFPVVLRSDVTFPENGVFYNQPLHLKNTYVQQWNLSFQKQLGDDWALSLSYLGNKTTHLWFENQANPAVYIPGNCTVNGKTSACSTTGNLDQRRELYLLNPAVGKYYSSIVQTDGGGNANYNGGLIGIQKRFTRKFSVLANYTWSHCMNESDGDQFLDGVDFQDPHNRKGDRASCASDRRHNVNTSAVISSPTFKSNTLQKLAGGWQMSSIFRVQSGAPLTVTTGRDAALVGGTQRPILVGNPDVDNPTLTKWFNTDAFLANGPGQYGSAGRSIITGNKTINFDVSLTRRFNITEQQRFEFRAEGFNVLNLMRPGNPNTSLNSSLFGQVTSALDPRIMQFALKYVF